MATESISDFYIFSYSTVGVNLSHLFRSSMKKHVVKSVKNIVTSKLESMMGSTLIKCGPLR